MIRSALIGLVFATAPLSAFAQQSWKPFVYSDLSQPGDGNAAYIELWSDRLKENDRTYAARGKAAATGRRAPAIEAHYVVRSPTKTAVISLLNTVSDCTSHSLNVEAQISVKSCPIRVAIYVGADVTVTSGYKGCVLEAMTPDRTLVTGTGLFAAYDAKSRSFKLGALINHTPVAGCSAVIPIYSRLLPGQ